MAVVEVNRTNTNMEAWIDLGAAHIAAGTKKLNDILSAGPIHDYVVQNLDKLLWATPLLVVKIAPYTFTASLILGFVGGVFSGTSTKQIFENVDHILNGGVPAGEERRGTDFKVSLIFFTVILNYFIPFPSLPMVYGAVAGVILGAKLSLWVPDDLAKQIATKIDAAIPLPLCPGFEKK